MNYKIDVKRITDGHIRVEGWVIPKKINSDVNFTVFNSSNKSINYNLARTKREDVKAIYFGKDYEFDYFGFSIEFDYDETKNETYILVLDDRFEKVKIKLNKDLIDKFNTKSRKKIELLIAYFNINTFKRAFDFLLKEGPTNFIKKTIRKVKGINVDYDYGEWYKLTKPSEDYYIKQRKNNEFHFNPFYSIVIPIFDTSDEFLKLLFKSIFSQTYSNFEVCVVDATDYKKNNNNPRKFFEKLLDINDPLKINKYSYDINNIHIKYLNENKSIADNTNVAIQMAKGEYIVLCDHDDELTSDALYEVTKLINISPNAELIYSDEDKVDMNNSSYFEPAFKPDFNLDMLLSVNYFCHLTVVKKSLIEKLHDKYGAYERKEFNGAQDYDLFLRLVNILINDSFNNGKYDISKIYHIPKVLYHWRCHKNSTSKNTGSKTYAFENGCKAVEDFYKNSQINFNKVLKVEKGFDYGLYHTVFETIQDKLISIIIPNKDHVDDLDKLLKSLKRATYKNFEIVICENNSTEDKTFEYYKSLENIENLKVVYYKDIFNYSKINNFASTFAHGEYYLFINNDIELIKEDSLSEMKNTLDRMDVGAVGAKLLYKDDTYQHAGVIIGIGGIADHAFKGIYDTDHTYMNRAELSQDLNAVTAACIMVKKSVFESINGFDEKIAVAFNDIDLCLRIRERGYLIVYNPYSSFYHYESKSRGYEDTPEKVKRFNKEFAYFVNKWPKILEKGDEYYNINLSLRKNNFSLRDLKYEKIGEQFPIPKEIKTLRSLKY